MNKNNLENYQIIINNEINNNVTNINNGKKINFDCKKAIKDNENNRIISNTIKKPLESKKREFFRIEKIRHKTTSNDKNLEEPYYNIEDNNSKSSNKKIELILTQNINNLTNNSINYSLNNEKECENNNKKIEKESNFTNLSDKKDIEIFI